MMNELQVFPRKIFSKLTGITHQTWPSDYHHQIIDSLRTIFIHVPKTAGGSIQTTLSQFTSKRPLSGHTPSFEFRLICPDRWHSYFKFGFVRNPWDRLVSAFFHLQDVHSKEPFVAQYIMPFGDDFDGFMRNFIANHHTAIYWKEHLKPQVYFLCNDDGSVAVDFIGKFENLEKDWDIVCERLAIDIALPHLRKSKKKNLHYSRYYSDASKKLVSELYSQDIEKFGYTFNEI